MWFQLRGKMELRKKGRESVLKDVKGSVLSGFAALMRTGDLKDWISKKKMNRGKKKKLGGMWRKGRDLCCKKKKERKSCFFFACASLFF